MAVITQEAVRVAFTVSGNSPEVIHVPEGISQTFKIGAPVYLTASGTCKIMVSTAGAAFDTIRKRYLGVALAAASNTTSPSAVSNLIPVAIDNGDTVFIGNIASKTSAATASINLQEIGKAGGMSFNSSRLYFDRNGSAAGSLLRCRGIVDKSGDQYGRVLFAALDTARVFRV